MKPILKIILSISVIALMLSFLLACEPAIQLTIGNQFNVSLAITEDPLDQHGISMGEYFLGTSLPGQETVLPQYLTLRQGIIGWTVVIKARDSSNTLFWQRSWAFDDFLKLQEAGWKITISPETNQLP